MPAARTPGRWPYRAAPSGRRQRVVRRRDDAETRGVHTREAPVPVWRPTRKQARLAAAGAALVMLMSAAWWAYHSPWLTVSDVTVVGAASLTPQQVRDAAGVDGASLFGLDLGSAQARVAALAKVRKVTVKKHGFHGVEINLQERTAWGSWRINNSDVAIDDEGSALDGLPPKGSPVITEVNPLRPVKPGDRLDANAVQLAVRIAREAPSAFGRSVVALVYAHDHGLTAVLSGATVDDTPVWVMFGDGQNYDYKVAALYVLFQRARQDELALNVVDLRFGDRLSFR